MTTFNSPLIRAQITNTLRALGAKRYQLIHTPRDANGQPAGEPAPAGTLYGLCYVDPAMRQRIHIALPGIVASANDIPTLIAVKLCGRDPDKGDVIARCGKETPVMSAIANGAVITLTLEEVI